MIVISNETWIRGAIERGCVYNFSPEKNVANHYYVVINKNPKKDKEIYLVSFTSKKENVVRFVENLKLDPKTFVEVEMEECPFLSKPHDSCINCNYRKKYELQELIDLIESSNGSCNCPKVPDSLLDRIIEGVKASRMIEPAVKSLI